MQDVLVRHDPKLPHIAMAWSRKQAKEFFETHLMPAQFPGWRVTDMTQRRVRYKPAKECRVHYRIRMTDGEHHGGRLVTMTFRPADKLGEMAERRNGSNGAGQRLFLPEFACLIEVYPTDWRLPGLTLAVDAGAVTELLASFGAGGVPQGRVTRVRQLRYRPGLSCVLHYALEAEDGGSQAFIGKVYNKRVTASAVREKLESLSPQAARAGLGIPRLLGWSPAESLVFMERAPGVGMDRLLFDAPTQDEAVATIHVAAEALARFHRLQLDAPIARTLASEHRRLRRRMRRIGRVAGSLAGRAKGVLDMIDGDDLATPEEQLCVIHGDFKPDQLLVHAGKTSLVDLDRAGLGDPAVDVGNMTAALRKQAVVNELALFRQLPEEFLERYLEQRPEQTLARRARLYHAMALVRMVLAKFERAPRSYAREGQDWPWLALLDEARQCLANQ